MNARERFLATVKFQPIDRPAVGKAVLVAQTVSLPNVGVTVDLGHALIAQEVPGESVSLLQRFGRLFQVHVNDNYRDWDHDLIVGAADLWSTLEFFYWLRKVGFDGWYVVDLHPYREDGSRALSQCIRNSERMIGLADRLLGTELETLQEAADAVGVSELLFREVLQIFTEQDGIGVVSKCQTNP